MEKSTIYRLRPSVSMIPLGEGQYEFFQSNTRRIKHLKFSNENLADSISNLSGHSLKQIISQNPNIECELESLFAALYEWCFIEDMNIANKIASHGFRRVLNFMADYFPSNEVFSAFENIQDATVLIVGLGGVGSWVANGLAQSGVRKFVLCDADVVARDNLNRALFFENDIGKSKIDAVNEKLNDLDSNIDVIKIYSTIQDEIDVLDIFKKTHNIDLVINCADYPSVDQTSEIIGKACMEYNIPHIISGGYNLHLSLIGPTIIPNETACYKCIDIELSKKIPDDFKFVRKLYRKNRNIGNIAPLAGISASFTINEAIRVLVKSSKLSPQMANKRGEFNFLTSEVSYTHYDKKGNCPWCSNGIN